MRTEKLSVNKVCHGRVCSPFSAFNRYASYHILFDAERIGAMLRVTLCGFRCRVHGCFSGLCAPEINAVFGRSVQAAGRYDVSGSEPRPSTQRKKTCFIKSSTDFPGSMKCCGKAKAALQRNGPTCRN